MNKLHKYELVISQKGDMLAASKQEAKRHVEVLAKQAQNQLAAYPKAKLRIKIS